MLFGCCIHSLDPQGPHVSLLSFAVSVGILQGLLHAFSSYSDAVFAPTSEAFGKAEDLKDARTHQLPLTRDELEVGRPLHAGV